MYRSATNTKQYSTNESDTHTHTQRNREREIEYACMHALAAIKPCCPVSNVHHVLTLLIIRHEKYYSQHKIGIGKLCVVGAVAIGFMLHQLASSINKLHAFCMFRVDTKQW